MKIFQRDIIYISKFIFFFKFCTSFSFFIWLDIYCLVGLEPNHLRSIAHDAQSKISAVRAIELGVLHSEQQVKRTVWIHNQKSPGEKSIHVTVKIYFKYICRLFLSKSGFLTYFSFLLLYSR